MEAPTSSPAVMALQPYVAPVIKATAFNCPHCGAFARQDWGDFALISGSNPIENVVSRAGGHRYYLPLDISVCFNCRKECLWFHDRMFYPDFAGVPAPNLDLSDEIKGDYAEAAAILQRSPRGAGALLRLCVQKLCVQLGQPGENINADIKALVKEGLPVRVQQALDALRVIGNNAVHPLELDLKDDVATVTALFC